MDGTGGLSWPTMMSLPIGFLKVLFAVRWNGDTEYMAVLPDDFEESEVDTDDDSSVFSY